MPLKQNIIKLGRGQGLFKFFLTVALAVFILWLAARFLGWPANNELWRTIELKIDYRDQALDQSAVAGHAEPRRSVAPALSDKSAVAGHAEPRRSVAPALSGKQAADLTIPAKLLIINEALVLETPASGETDLPGKAKGEIVIKSQTSYDQPLIATTRFLFANGVLFRLVSPVTVTAGGEITAVIEADQPGAAGDVPAGRFTIPGLSKSGQALIYGVSTQPMTGGSARTKVVTEADLLTLDRLFLAEAEAKVKNLVINKIQPDESFLPALFVWEKTGEPQYTSAGDQRETASLHQPITLKAVVYQLGAVSRMVAPYFNKPPTELNNLKIELIKNSWEAQQALVRVIYEESLSIKEER